MRRGAGQEIGNRLSRWLRLRFFLILLMLAGVSLGAFTVFHLLVKGQDQGATVINISGRQRMLVQRLAADALRLVDAPIVEREALRHKMQTEAQLMATAHRGLEYD
ncbi:MAG TPA: type IV pili methyl-accepting chemotaxis transducer N-terminal domain-containing protein, partial [Patescibacteria group bacterium]|nr:type IV pili methyl-accepting chemotaxis transducer N-terminal domain-containing protein [Patescibacteria group bacterium]